MPRTLSQFVSDIIRETRGQATPFEAQQAFQDALGLIDGRTNWEFLLTTTLINIHSQYTTGTVSVAAGSLNVTGNGTSWPTVLSPVGEYREIRFNDRPVPYYVDTVTSGTTLTLKTALSGDTGSDIVNGKYTMYQAVYPLPADCEPGRDLCLKGPLTVGTALDGTIPKRQRLEWEWYWTSIRRAVQPLFYTDDRYDEVNRRATIRLEPYPTRTWEFRLDYYRKLTVPSLPADTIPLPEAFERAPILMAASNVMRKKNLPGWQVLRQEAGDMLNKLYDRYAVSPAYENKIMARWDWDMEYPNTPAGADGQLYTWGT